MKKFTLLVAALMATMFTFAEDVTMFSENFSQQGDWTINNISLSSGMSYCWKFDSNNGVYYAKSSAFISGNALAAESWLISPAIDLSTATKASFSFEHAAKFQNGVLADEFQVYVAANPSNTFDALQWTKLNITNFPPKDNKWTWVNAGNFDLAAFVGQANVRIAFCYKSTAAAADTWEIKNLVVIGNGKAEGDDDEELDYSWEPTEKTNITAAYTSADYIFEDGQLDVYMSNDDSALELLFNVSALNETTIVPVGTYQINNTMAEGTVMASPGGDDYYDYPSVYTTDYNEAGYYSTAYYLVSGTVTVSQEGEDLKIVVNATTYNGSTINATMMGAITEYEGGGDGENDYSAEPTATTTINASFTSGEYVFYEEYSELDLTLENDDATLELAFNVSALDPTTVIPVGIYEISDTYAEGTVTASAGAFDFLGFALSLPSVYSVYDDEYNETPYYLVGGTVTVSQEGENLKIVVNATSYNGSTINATMIGKISEYGAIDDAVRNIEVDNNVFARNGRIFCDEAARIYSVNGMEVTRMNGNLEGIYIVKNGNKVSKVVVTK